MIKAFSEQVLVELQEGLLLAGTDIRSPQVILRKQCGLINEALGRLQDVVLAHPFQEDAEVIEFHKIILPQFYALLSYARIKYELDAGLPVSGLKAKRKYYTEFLEQISGFFSQQSFYYDYWTGDGLLLDELLYTASEPFNVLQPLVPGLEAGPGTAMSRLGGMFMAYERLRDEVLGMLYQLEGEPALSGSKVSASGELSLSGAGYRFLWKGEVINLIELAHGIYVTGQLEASVGIVEFFKALGDFFGVNLRVPKRGFDDLKKRKTMSQTHFCELMGKTLLAKMEQEDAYDPDKLARKNGF